MTSARWRQHVSPKEVAAWFAFHTVPSPPLDAIVSLRDKSNVTQHADTFWRGARKRFQGPCLNTGRRYVIKVSIALRLRCGWC